MIETVVGFIGTVVISWWFILFLIVTGFIACHSEHDIFTLLITLAAGFVVFNLTGITWLQLGIYALAHIPIGVTWSIFRWKKLCKKRIEEVKENPDSFMNKEQYVRKDLNPLKSIDKIVSWVIAWPFSFIESVLGDLYDAIETIVKKYIIRIYTRISDKYIKELY